MGGNVEINIIETYKSDLKLCGFSIEPLEFDCYKITHLKTGVSAIFEDWDILENADGYEFAKGLEAGLKLNGVI